MKAVFLRKPRDLYVDFNVPVPECSEDMVLVNVKEIGICGSDLHYYTEGRIGDHVVTAPHILGHEASGVVAQVGKHVHGFAPGDRVCIEPGVPCMRCFYCLEGHYNLCESVRFSGAPPYPGMFREYLAHDPQFLHALPPSVSFTEGALVEPLAVAHNAIAKTAIRTGDTVMVTGAGPIGFACVEMARVAGAARVIVSEPSAFQRAMALEIGADHAIDPLRVDLFQSVREITKGRMCDCAIEASGATSGVIDAIRCVRKGGRTSLVGMGEPAMPIPHADIVRKELIVSGVFRYSNSFRPVINLIAARRLLPERWVSHRFPLEKIEEAIATASSSINRLKVVVTT